MHIFFRNIKSVLFYILYLQCLNQKCLKTFPNVYLKKSKFNSIIEKSSILK